MNQVKKKILIHLSLPIEPLNYDGYQRRVVGALKYFRDRKQFFAVDAVSGNRFGNTAWNLQRKQEALEFVDNLFIYRGENNLFDYLYNRSKSFFNHKLLRQQLPVDSDYFAPPNYVKFVQTLISQHKYDFIWINDLDHARLATDLKFASTRLLDMHDITSRFRLVRKNISYSKNLKFDYESNFNKEIKMLNKFDTIIVNSKYEMSIISLHLLPYKLHWIPTLVENSNIASNLVPYLFREFKYDLLFIGANNQPNKDGISFFLNSIFPEIFRSKSDVKIVIAGKIASLIQLDASLKENVDCLGYVPDLSDLYLKSRLVICPLLTGSGTKIKLVEAMSYAMPIVTTETCASALGLIDGLDAFITDKPDIFAQKVLSLLEKPELAQKLSEGVAMTFENEYSSSVIYSKLDKVFGIIHPQT